MKKKQMIILVISIAAILFILVLPIWNAQIVEYNVHSFADTPYYTQQDIEIAFQIDKNPHIMNITSTKVEQYKRTLPFIETIEIEKVFPNQLIVNVVEKQPRAYIPFAGSYLLIDKNAIVIEETRNVNLSLPVIEGITVEKFILGERLDKIDDDVLLALEVLLNEAINYQIISEVKFINIGNLGNIILKIRNLDVIIGTIEDCSKKMAWLSDIYLEYSVGVLDLSYVDTGEAVLKPLQ
ncbi:MAG: hypothetical protein BEN19_00410 [Epulopiscium sp. Nuni2H_MBin003]|nr:MAG: hypothetical protein BEN19_00410 [Epulopiscium sp. Nuni2H_MBin003]